MATIVFYEKPGCGNNTKQKVWLATSGHAVLAKNLLTEKWTAERLRPFFGDLPVAQWFNPAAPRVKSGEVDPSTFSESEALNMMLAEPLLIRRPLMEVEGEFRVGFDAEAVHAWIGLNDAKPQGDIEACPNVHARSPHPCPLPLAVEGDEDSLREDHDHQANPCPTPEAPSPQSSGGTTSQSTTPASGQVAGYPASGGGSEREQPCLTLEASHA